MPGTSGARTRTSTSGRRPTSCSLNCRRDWRPTDKLRVDARYQLQPFRRRTDDSIVGIRRIPRLKVEYQVTRPIFVRVGRRVRRDWQDDLRDDSRTDLPIFIRNPETGGYERASAFRGSRSAATGCSPISRRRAPCSSPATATRSPMPSDGPLKRLERTSDGFFLKISYLFRL